MAELRRFLFRLHDEPRNDTAPPEDFRAPAVASLETVVVPCRRQGLVEPSGLRGMVALEVGATCILLSLTVEDLQRGVVVGRCEDGAVDPRVARHMPDCVSRAHLRLSLRGLNLLAEDLGSSNGTYFRGLRVSTAVMPANGDSLRLAGAETGVVVRWLGVVH